MSNPVRDHGQWMLPELFDPVDPRRPSACFYFGGRKKTCDTCRALIPDHLLDCPACAERKLRAQLLEQQKLFLPAILAGGERIVLTHPAQEPSWHMGLPSVRAYLFCGLFAKPGWKRRRTLYADLPYFQICTECRKTFDQVKKTVCAEKA